jgi:hypothetical protein
MRLEVVVRPWRSNAWLGQAAKMPGMPEKCGMVGSVGPVIGA